MHGYAVIDTETTGILAGGWRHRIVEIAVVHVSPDGAITDEWSTLVNPERDLGPRNVHGIRAVDARRAPVFGELAGDLFARLRGRVPVAHNWSFDAMHLRSEFDRLGIETPFEASSGVCTMRAAGRIRLGSRRSLADCCAAAGVPERSWHSARDDAMAAAELLGYFIRCAPDAVALTEEQAGAALWDWPRIPVGTAAAVRRSEPGHAEPHFLARLVERMPRDEEPAVDAYLAMLDAALLDRDISVTEGDMLVDLAHDLGLHRNELVALHLSYVRDLAREAWADEIVTDAERHDLLTVATLLALDCALVDEILDEERVAAVASLAAPSCGRLGGLELRPGDKVVLTGSMVRGREEIVAQAASTGVRVTGSVSRQTRVVVAADPDSLSGKARKARELGVPVVSEDAFLTALDRLAGPISASAATVNGGELSCEIL
ncbi:exonuclease domain-containing protein [Amycolatopsis circi]|uniref:exonuclease domain-containing protein n=1 Tax=Amycolatopsis circi TaxID=871959 RepID=UPI000E280E04|nr:exonuclease domain-containing protein [Amycolatopsis circi]